NVFPDGNFFECKPPGERSLEFRKLRIETGDVQFGNYEGLFGFARTGGGRRYPIVIGSESPPSGFPKFPAYLPQGFYMGCDASRLPDLGNSAVFFFVADDEPSASTWDALSATTEIQRGSVVWMTGRGAEQCLALRCTTTGIPGADATFERLGELIDEATVTTS